MADNSNKKEKKKFSFSDLIYNDKYLVVLSIFLAFIVWIGSSLSVGADDTKTIKITALSNSAVNFQVSVCSIMHSKIPLI